MAIDDKDIYKGDGSPLGDVIKEFEEWNKKMAESLQLSRRLGDEMSSNLRREVNNLANNSAPDAVQSVNRLNTSLNNQTRNVEQLTASQRESQAVSRTINNLNSRLSGSYADNAREISELREQVTRRNRALRQQIQYDRASEGSLARNRIELSRLTAQYNVAGRALQRQLAPQINNLTNTVRQQEQLVQNHTRDVGKYQKAWQGVVGFIAKAGGVIMAFKGLSMAFSAVNERMQANAKNTRIVMNMMGLHRGEAKKLRKELTALASIYNVEFRDIAVASGAISTNFLITKNETAELIKDSLKLATNQQKTIQQIKEYAPQFKKAGASAKEMIAILTQGERLAVWNDKAPDTIKEAALAIGEMTAATTLAVKPMESVARLEFDRLQRSGKLLEAMQLVAREMKKGYFTMAQYQTLVADVFKGAGEDSGIFIEKLAEMDLDITKLNDNLSESEKATNKLTKSWSLFTDSFADSESSLSAITLGLKNISSGVLDFVTNMSKASTKDAISSFLRLFNVGGVAGQGVIELSLFQKELDSTSESINRWAELREGLGGKLNAEGFEFYSNSYIDTIKKQLKLTQEQEAELRMNLIDSYSSYMEEIQSIDVRREKEIELKRKTELAGEKELNRLKLIEAQKALEERKKLDAKMYSDRIKKADDEYNKEKNALKVKKETEKIDFMGGATLPVNVEFDYEGLADQFNQTQSILADANYIYQNISNDTLDKSAERIAEYDSLMSNSQSRLDAELQKKTDGQANAYEQEKRNIDELKVKRSDEMEHQAELAKKQAIISQVIQAAKIGEAISNIFAQDTSKLGGFGLISSFISIAAMLVQMKQFKSEAMHLKDGEVMIQGKGTPTSDSIPAMLSRNESIINAKATMATPKTLELINSHAVNDAMLLPLINNIGRTDRATGSADIRSNTSAIKNLTDQMRNGTASNSRKRKRNGINYN